MADAKSAYRAAAGGTAVPARTARGLFALLLLPFRTASALLYIGCSLAPIIIVGLVIYQIVHH